MLETYQNKTEVRCVILMSNNVFWQLFHSPLAEISNFALSAALNFLSKSFSLIGRNVGSILTSLQPSLIICASRVSHWVVRHWCVTTQFTYEAVIHRICLELHKHSGWVCRSPSICISGRWHWWIRVCLVHIQSLYCQGWQPRRCSFFHCSFYM